MNTPSNTLSQKLDLRQSQQLVMTPQLQQAIKLLQLNNMELSEVVEAELERNPLLEKDETQADGASDGEGASEPGFEDKDNIAESFESANTSDIEYSSSSKMPESMGNASNLKFEDRENALENRLETQKSLREHLTEQLQLACDDPRDRMIGGLLIDGLSEAGYLREDLEDLAARLACSPARIDKLLRVMKGFDPPGVFAKDLSECLAIQLHDRGQLDGAMQALLDNLPLLANHEFAKLAKICEVNETYLADMIAEIKALNPKPAAEFDYLIVQTAIPDVLMKRLPKHEGGGWRVELNTETLPRVLVNNEYYTQISQGAMRKEDKEYITTQLNNANWLVRAMDQRAQTILKVAAEIVEQQDAFFNYGIEFLKPLKLVDIAEEIQMHESTVSRVTTNKYIGTPRGLFELKYFFSTALVSDDGLAHSAQAVKARIKSLIDDEDPKKILSDDKIVALLKEEGIDLARRTVTKYREGMNIGSSVQRRRIKGQL